MRLYATYTQIKLRTRIISLRVANKIILLVPSHRLRWWWHGWLIRNADRHHKRWWASQQKIAEIELELERRREAKAK